jgi:predicted alpha-1,2-mannosidase
MTSVAGTPLDMFHGVDCGGNCLPGPSIPRGLVRVGPDMVNHNTSGYCSNNMIRHFSHLHVAGTGGPGRYGNIGLMPHGQRPIQRLQCFSYSNEEAEPGYYEVSIQSPYFSHNQGLTGNIRCEMTATHSCALHRWNFDSTLQAWLRIDIGACIGGKSIGGWTRWLNDRVLTGCGLYQGGWGHNEPYRVFFRMEFSAPKLSSTLLSANREEHATISGEGPGIVISAKFGNLHTLEARVGISFVSEARAAHNLRKEAGDRDFDQVRAMAKSAWAEIFDRFQVEGGTEKDTILWHTLWQRLYVMPSRLEPEEVPWIRATSSHFNDLYCLWDSCRLANSFLSWVDPVFSAELVNCLVDIGEQTGWIPDAWMAGSPGFIQGGISASYLLLEAALKGLPGYDPQRALPALINTLECESPDPLRHGRHPQWARMGYIPLGVRNCTSKTIEYACNDHHAAQLALFCNQPEIAERCSRRAARIWESWHPDHLCFAPRSADGKWVDFNPWRPTCEDFWNDPHYYEGTGYDYLFTSWHLLPEIVSRFGSTENLSIHLDRFMDACLFWKEINLQTPWVYHLLGHYKKHHTSLSGLISLLVCSGRKGLADNEDMGTWSSWWLSSAMGIFPIPATTDYLIGVPRFEKIVVRPNSNSTPLEIRRIGDFKGQISKVILNGKPLDAFRLSHDHLIRGGHLEIHTNL